MKYEIREVKNGILQVTTTDERWYIREKTDGTKEFVPSVTWICDHYPKGIGFYKWLANKGWDEAEALKEAAADKGSKVHQAIALLLDGMTIKYDTTLSNPDTKELETITLQEYAAVMSFVDWYKEAKPKILDKEFAVWGDGYAGTVDMLCEIGEKTYIVDFKTSQSIWPSHELQVSAYKHAIGKDCALAILQLGYRLNKKKYKFTELEDKYTEFLAAKTIWANETKGVMPLQKDYPLSLQL